ncbi:MAG: DUF1295 domain-containing protein [Clostridia bacterium]|nr:DUF1295 domain-containing protein [Clostridia bacterium]
MKPKTKGVLTDLLVYTAAFAAGAVPFALLDNMFAATAAFTAAATIAVFAASCAFKDVSVYDPYWSVAPPVMLAAAMVKYRLWNINSALLLAAVAIWSARLTANWFYTYKGIGREDWRYAQYRERFKTPLFLAISFFGLHFVPTAVVWLGMVSVFFSAQKADFAPLSLAGLAVMLAAVALEYFSDRAIHGFLREHKGERKTCDISVWKYSRHPNYLGEMSFWTGAYLYFLPLCPENWYCGLGFLSVIALFLAVSIPMMEKHNAARRTGWEEYKAKTSVLFILPNRKIEN